MLKRLWDSGAIAGVVAFCFLTGLLTGSAIEQRRPTLDSAQSAFEKSDESARNYNWPAFRQAKDGLSLRCSDAPDGSLRACVMRSPAYDPMTGARDGYVDEPFACTKTACSWVRVR